MSVPFRVVRPFLYPLEQQPITLSEAVLGGLLEVVERDPLFTWLQRPRLPCVEVDVDSLPAGSSRLSRFGNINQHRGPDFDATTDFGIPVLYAMQLADSDPVLNQIVAATCDLDPQRALAKIHRESASLLSRYEATPDLSKTSTVWLAVGGAIHQAISTHRGVFTSSTVHVRFANLVQCWRPTTAS